MNNNPIILFDGVCNLCNNSVDFIIKRDKKETFRFCPLQSETGNKLIEKYKIQPETDSVILIQDNHAYILSDAAIEIARHLTFPWNTAVIVNIIPKKLRDNMYRFMAKNRYRWFGKRETCRVPAPSELKRFI